MYEMFLVACFFVVVVVLVEMRNATGNRTDLEKRVARSVLGKAFLLQPDKWAAFQ